MAIVFGCIPVHAAVSDRPIVGQPPFVFLSVAPDSPEVPKRYTAGSQLAVTVIPDDTDGFIEEVFLTLQRIETDLEGNRIETIVRPRTRLDAPFVESVSLPSFSGLITSYELVAEVCDDQGNGAVAVEEILVFNASRPLPRVTFNSPSNGSQVVFGSSVEIDFTVEAFGQTLAGVAVFENGNQIELLTSAPFQFTYTPVRAGPKTLSVVPFYTTAYVQGTGQSRVTFDVFTASESAVSISVLDFDPAKVDADFVSQVFTDVVHRSATSADLTVWLPRLESGELTRDAMVAELIQHAIAKDVIAVLAAYKVLTGGWPSYAELGNQISTHRDSASDGLVAVVTDLLSSPAYEARYSSPPTIESLAVYANQEAFAFQLYANLSSRDPTLLEIQATANAPGSLSQASGYNVVGLEAFLADFVRKNLSVVEAEAEIAGLIAGLERSVPSSSQVTEGAVVGLSESASRALESSEYNRRFLKVSRSPRSVRVAEGGGVFLEVGVLGGENHRYQWYRNGISLPGATSAILALRSILPEESGAYYAVVEGRTSSVASGSAVVNVVTGGESRLSNLSTRAIVGEGDDSLISGFIFEGAEPLQILSRVVGPTLGGLGVSVAATDPKLSLVGSGESIAVNSKWGDAANQGEIRMVSASLGAFALQEGSLDAAALVELSPGSYTVVGTQGDTTNSIALTEIYSGTDAGSKLINLSSRARVGEGEQVMIAGFVISGDVSRRLLIRAVGPGLLRFGVPGAIANPALKVMREDTELVANDDWSAGLDSNAVQVAMSEAGAALLTPGSLDAAVVLSLEPGQYTVIVSGEAGSSGIALVEIYDLDP